MGKRGKKVICYLAGAAGDWGGASRVLFTNIGLIDRTKYEPIILLPSEGPILPFLESLGVRYFLWGGRREPDGVFRYLRDIVSSASFFARNRVDVLHFNHGFWRPAEVIAARMLRIPIVTHYHVVIDKPGPFVKFSSRIVAVSEYAARQSEPKSVPMTVIHNSIDLARFDGAHDVRAELGIANDDIVVSFIGQIRAIKGIDLFIRMAHQISGSAIKFLIVGECRDPARFEGSYTEEQLRREIGDDTRIRYVGYRSDVQNIFASSDVIVMPSRWGEPFGLINIEAGAAGKPMISTRDGGIPEVIRHGENGFLVEPDELEGLVHYARQLIDDEALRRRMGARARQIVEEKFTDLPVRKLEKLYDELTA